MQVHTSTPKFVVAFAALLTTLLLARTGWADTMTLMWDANPEPAVIGYIVHVGTQSGSYTQNVDVGPAVSWVFPSAVAGQRYCFAVSAYAPGPLEGPQSNEVCGFSNTPPTLVNPGNQTSVVGQSDSLQLSGSDPDGSAVTYSATGLPAGLTLMASTGFISGTPTTAGSYPVTARVSDGALTTSQTFTWSVQAPDTTAPVVTITTPTSASTHTTSGSSVAIGGTASDNVSVTQVAWVNDRGGSGTASGSGTWSASGIALATGTNVLTVTARDAAGNTSSDVLTVIRNTPPTLIAVANQSSSVGLATTLQLVGADADGDALTYSASGIPPGLSIAVVTGLISGTPSVPGTYPVTVTVSDGALGASRSFTWTINASSVTPLQVSLSANMPSPQPPGTSVTFTASPTGSVGPYQYRWSVLSRRSWKTMQAWSAANTFMWTPTKRGSTYEVRVELRSATGEIVSATLPFVIRGE